MMIAMIHFVYGFIAAQRRVSDAVLAALACTMVAMSMVMHSHSRCSIPRTDRNGAHIGIARIDHGE